LFFASFSRSTGSFSVDPVSARAPGQREAQLLPCSIDKQSNNFMHPPAVSAL
jgi:hypothetical protein